MREKFALTLYEKNNYVGGHTNTVTVVEGQQQLHVDTAFMVYNETTYPLLTRLFAELRVKTKPTSMSFSVQHVPSGLEFSGTGYNGLFAQRKNIFKPSYVRMLMEIDRFSKEAVEVLEEKDYLDYSLAEYVSVKGYSPDFVQRFLIPMSSAVWSTPPDTMLSFPVVTLVRFFKNHCFLGLSGHLQWRTCVDGSRQYRDRLLAELRGRIWTQKAAIKVIRSGGKVTVVDAAGGQEEYDKVIVAAHADEALDLLDSPTANEKNLLQKFPYYSNRATLHTDISVMPKTQRAWSSWNYRFAPTADGRPAATTIYYMNSLQGLSKTHDYFISINDPGLIDAKKIIWETAYRHPVYTVLGQYVQKDLPQLNLSGPIYYCGAYFRYGFHEDGLWSALNAARAVSGEHIWP